jgi:N-formylglutamate amidohydrolase
MPELLDPPFEVIAPPTPAEGAPVVFNSPHSGARYPAAFLAATRLDALTLRRSEDAFVDELFLPAVGLGAPLMRAHFPRAFLDVNREPYELDPRMFDGRLPADANTRSLRVAGGLGTIARVVGDAQEIYAGRLPGGVALERIETLYNP